MKPKFKNLKSRLRAFGTFISAALSSQRSHGTFATTGLSSLSNFALSIAIARAGTVEEVATFAIGFAGFMVITGISRSMIGEPSSARLLNDRSLRIAGKQVSGYGLCSTVIMVLIGLATNQSYLIAVGAFGHAITIYDYSKFVSTVFGRPQIAVAQEFIKTLIILIAIFTPAANQDPFILFLVWLTATGIVGYTGTIIQRINLKPSLSTPEIPRKESVSYAFDFILGSGTTQITTFALGAFAAPTVNASVRGAGTLFGPITMIATSIRALVLPFLSRKLRSGSDLSPSVHVSLSLLIAALPLIVLINFIPPNWGYALLGETWHFTKSVLPILSVEVISTMLTTIPFAGHRSLGAHKRVFYIRLILALVRLLVIISAAIVGGHIWAAIAMVFTSVLGLITWWISYSMLMKNLDGPDPRMVDILKPE